MFFILFRAILLTLQWCTGFSLLLLTACIYKTTTLYWVLLDITCTFELIRSVRVVPVWHSTRARLASYRKEAGGPAPERHGQHIVEHVHVLAEPVEHAAHGRAVEEADGRRVQHAGQQSRVQRSRGRQRAQVQRQRRHRHRHHCHSRMYYCTPAPQYPPTSPTLHRLRGRTQKRAQPPSNSFACTVYVYYCPAMQTNRWRKETLKNCLHFDLQVYMNGRFVPSV